jgi:4-amino-4-deoxy-L-arabinose transferase-like glycosyltransferase
MVSYLSLGQSEFSARLPSAIAAILTVFAVAVLASRLSGSPRGISAAGFWSATVLATCLLMVMAGRAATPDALLIATSTLGIAILVIGSLAPSSPFSSGNVCATRWVAAAAGYTCLGFAALAKGPVGIILPLIVVHVWWMINKRLESVTIELWNNDHQGHSKSRPKSTLWKKLGLLLVESWKCFNPLSGLRAVLALRTFPGLLLTLLVAAPWYVTVGLATDGAFLQGFFIEHNLGRAITSMEGHNGSIFFYPVAFVVGIFPWSLWLIPIAAWTQRAFRENVVQRQLAVLGTVWIAVYITAFSLASTKLPSYITPCFAGAALLIGSYWKQFESRWHVPKFAWRVAANSLAIVTGIGILTAILVISRMETMPRVAYAGACGLAIATAGVLGLLCERQRQHWIPRVWMTCAVLFQVSLFGLGARQASTYREDTELVMKTQQVSPSEHWLGVGPVEPSWVYYLEQSIEELSSKQHRESIWKSVHDRFVQFPDARLVLVGDSIREFEQQTGQLFSDLPEFVELGRCERFLKPGEIAIYRLNPPAAALRMAEQVPTNSLRPR